MILGVGFAADTPAIRKEFAAAGVPFERRVGRFLETLEICRALWSRDNVSFSGKHFTLDGATIEPKPHRAGGPPIWIGGSGPTAFREAARFDAWFPTGPSVEFFAEHFPRHPGGGARGRSRRRRGDGCGLSHAGARPQSRRRRGAHGHVPRDVLRGAGARDQGPAGQLRGAARRAAWSGSQRWIDAGARHLALRFAGGDQLAQVDEVASRLLPRLTLPA